MTSSLANCRGQCGTNPGGCACNHNNFLHGSLCFADLFVRVWHFRTSEMTDGRFLVNAHRLRRLDGALVKCVSMQDGLDVQQAHSSRCARTTR